MLVSIPVSFPFMAQFRYVARNTQGELVDGMLTCNDRSAALRQIEQLKCVPIKIEPVVTAGEGGESSGASAKSSGKAAPKTAPSSSAATEKPAATGPVRTLSHAQIQLFTEQLAHLLSAGMRLDEALGILVKRIKYP